MLQWGGPFLLPSQPFLTLSPTPSVYPLPPLPTAKENSLTDPSPETLLLGQTSMGPHPAKFEPYLLRGGIRSKAAPSPLIVVAPALRSLDPGWTRAEVRNL